MNQTNTKNNELIQLISNSLLQSNESSNIILQAISQGISTGLTQGIASGNIKLSFQDIISLASIFKPNNEVPLQLINKLVTTDETAATASLLTNTEDSTVSLSKGSTVTTVANHDSHASCQDSSGLPSSVHVFDVTVENRQAYEPLVYHRVSETANDNVDNSSLSISSSTSGVTSAESLVTINTTRKRTVDSNDEKEEPPKSHKRYGSSSNMIDDGIDNANDLVDYISSSCEEPKAVIEAHNKMIQKKVC